MNTEDRKLVFDKYCGHCAYCGCELQKGWHVDHLEPVVRNWRTEYSQKLQKYVKVNIGCQNPFLDNINNWMPACAKCNINKHSDTIEQFRNNIKKYLNSLNLRMVQYQMAKKYNLIQETGNEVVFYFELFKIKE